MSQASTSIRNTSIDDAIAADQQDPLAEKRLTFKMPENVIYLDGNSLGPLPIKAQERARDVVDHQWGNDLITSWNKHSWIDLPEQAGNKIARLIGANEGEVICCDSISVNLFKLLAIALQMNSGRTEILSQNDNFPTDLYITQGLNALVGENRCELQTVPADEILDAMSENTAVLMLTQVNFRTGHCHDIKQITEHAQAKGIIVIWDLAHSTGVMPLEMNIWGVDFAVGCGYKFLNGGPGAPAFVFAAKKYHQHLSQPLSGWMGHKAPFKFSPDYEADPSIKQFLCGTPPIISMSVLDAALDSFMDVEVSELRTKALALADFFHAQLDAHGLTNELNRQTPQPHALRGAQLSYSHPQAYEICQALIAQDVIADFRAPDIIRFGFSPLFLSFEEMYVAVQRLADIMQAESYKAAKFQTRGKVT